MKSQSYEKATARLSIRLRPSEKKKLHQAAAANGFSTVSAFVTHIVQKKPVHNPGLHKEFITVLHLLSFELNRIGNNINQAVHLMHLNKRTDLMQPSTVQQFNTLVKRYNEQSKELKILFQKIINYEPAGI